MWKFARCFVIWFNYIVLYVYMFQVSCVVFLPNRHYFVPFPLLCFYILQYLIWVHFLLKTYYERSRLVKLVSLASMCMGLFLMTTTFSIVYINSLWLVHAKGANTKAVMGHYTWRRIKPFFMTTYVLAMSQNPVPLAFWPPQWSMTPMYLWWFTSWRMPQGWTLHSVLDFETIVASNVAYPH